MIKLFKDLFSDHGSCDAASSAESNIEIPNSNKVHNDKIDDEVPLKDQQSNDNWRRFFKNIYCSEKITKNRRRKKSFRRKVEKGKFPNSYSRTYKLSEDLVPIDFLDIFLGEEFYNYLNHQTNSDAAQYLQTNLNLPSHSPLRERKDISLSEIKQFMPLYLLAGTVGNPELNQY